MDNLLGFQGSGNKKIIRQKWDLPIIYARKEAIGHSLTYLGMPGSHIEDLLDWRSVLGRIRTGVERNRNGKDGEIDKIIQRQIYNNVMSEGEDFSSGFELRRGNVEDLIINGVDSDRKKPQLGDGYIDGHFSYDLINLDFCGGIGYKDKNGQTKRVRAIRKLAERQQGTCFLLFLTLNVRDKMEDEVIDYLRSTSNRHQKDRFLRTALKWYSNLGVGKQAHILKAAIPLFIQQEFEVFGFSVFAYPPVMYEGTGDGSKLVHFVFDARHKLGSNLPVTSKQNPDDLVYLPMMEVFEETLRISTEQHPGFNFAICKCALNFLPHDTFSSVMEASPHALGE